MILSSTLDIVAGYEIVLAYNSRGQLYRIGVVRKR